MTSLSEYVSRMKETQKSIYYITGALEPGSEKKLLRCREEGGGHSCIPGNWGPRVLVLESHSLILQVRAKSRLPILLLWSECGSGASRWCT